MVSQSLTDNERALLKNTALFGGLSEPLFVHLIETSSIQTAEPGEILFMHGDPVKACFVVLEGWIKLFRLNRFGDEAIVNVFSRGESFAEAAVFSKGQYPAGAEAVSQSRLLRTPASALLSGVRENPDLACAMLASTSMHLQDLVRQIDQLKTQTGTQRVARFLASLCPVEEGPCTIGLPYDKTLIAGRLGMKPESLSRAFARLRNIGLRVEKNTAAISNVNYLRDYANLDRGDAEMTK
jgi:CRP-like cAMP-binding protein